MSCAECQVKELEATKCGNRVHGFIWADTFSWCMRDQVHLLDSNEFDLDKAFIITSKTTFEEVEKLLGEDYARECLSVIFS